MGDVLSFGWVLPACLAVGAGLGWLADKLFGTFPVITIVLALAGAAGGLVQVYRESEKLSGDGGRRVAHWVPRPIATAGSSDRATSRAVGAASSPGSGTDRTRPHHCAT